MSACMHDDADADPGCWPARQLSLQLSGQVALMLDPGNNDGAASSTLSGVRVLQHRPHRHGKDDIPLATGTPGIREVHL